MSTEIGGALRLAAGRLQASSASARLDAELLLAQVLGWPRSRLFARSEECLTAAQLSNFEQLLAQREAGAPVAYLLGQQEFWSLPLRVTADCLVPRPETEDLVAWVLQQDLPHNSVLDLGTGSGAIALALAHERSDWAITATDASAAALEVARSNAAQLGLSVAFALGDWFDALSPQHFDLIASNPPYLAADDPHLSDLQHEPHQALVAAAEGLADINQIIEQAPHFLHAGGQLVMEHGMSQGPAVRAQLHKRGFTEVVTQLDLAGLERFSHGRWGAPA